MIVNLYSNQSSEPIISVIAEDKKTWYAYCSNTIVDGKKTNNYEENFLKNISFSDDNIIVYRYTKLNFDNNDIYYYIVGDDKTPYPENQIETILEEQRKNDIIR